MNPSEHDRLCGHNKETIFREEMKLLLLTIAGYILLFGVLIGICAYLYKGVLW